MHAKDRERYKREKKEYEKTLLSPSLASNQESSSSESSNKSSSEEESPNDVTYNNNDRKEKERLNENSINYSQYRTTPVSEVAQNLRDFVNQFIAYEPYDETPSGILCESIMENKKCVILLRESTVALHERIAQSKGAIVTGAFGAGTATNFF